MATQITYKFQVQCTGQVLNTTMQGLLAAVPVDSDTLQTWGLRVTSDTAAHLANLVTRTIVLAMGPSAAAVVTPVLDASVTPSDIPSYTFTNGLDYIRPPVLSVADTAPGIGSGAACYATLGVFGVSNLVGGGGYTAATQCLAVGGQLAPGGTPATFTVTLGGGGTIAVVTIVQNGGPYNVPPTLSFVDVPGGGAGASATAQLGVSGVVPTAKGKSYTTPVVTVTPYFKSLNPDPFAAAQAAAVRGWMQDVIQKALGVSVIPSLGVVA